MKKKVIYIGIIILLFLGSIFFFMSNKEYYYGVFLSTDSKDLDKLSKYDVVVIDAQNFNSEDIDYLHNKGCVVYSYLNIGSLEEYRSYYDEYKYLSLGTYENWEDEVWIDVSDDTWITFITDKLATSLLDKEVDGLFIDNVDVYYYYNTNKIYDGLLKILKSLSLKTDKIIVNGGDTFITRYINENGNINSLISGVNQECVFTTIDFSNNTFLKANNKDKEYFTSYLDMCNKNNLDIYLLEYSNNIFLNNKIKKYCRQNNYYYYISSDIELN